MTHVSAPGKLMIAGEWSVLEPGNPCIVAAVDKRVHAEVRKSAVLTLELKDFDIKASGSFVNGRIIWDSDDPKLIFAKSSAETVVKYTGREEPFRLITYGSADMETKGAKLGFGSSSAATVAMVAAILGYFSKKEKFETTVFRLSAIASYNAQGKMGSCFDIAAAVYGGVITYERFDPKWLEAELRSSQMRDMIIKKWPGLKVRRLGIPGNLQLLVGYSGKAASTTEMIRQMKEFRQENSENYARIMGDISVTVQSMVKAWEASDADVVISLANRNEKLLRELTRLSNMPIETKELMRLSALAEDEGAGGKLSGAGGGDCAIAICFSEKTAQQVKSAWESNGFRMVNVKIDKQGIREE
ncbi:MAG: phosphomevalonate kinase [Candidatus Aenigmarchaeota archaeon]|nr:phosphomevalonate kinase [Candidatus Aenigmarchaeota archaeon]